MEYTIEKAKVEDLSNILALQRIAYQSEAELVGDFNIPPLTQTLEEVVSEFDGGVILKAVTLSGEKIIGSVRGRLSENTLYIGKLIVHPEYQNHGIGTALLSAVESVFPKARYELFTSDKSKKNLSLYSRNGYREFKQEALNEDICFVYLEKNKNFSEH